MEYVLIGCRSLTALVFVVSVASKLRSRRAYAEFAAATGRLAPRPAAAPTARRLAAAVVATELAVVPLVLAPATAPAGLGVAAALLLAFAGAILLAIRRGERAPCRCFGASVQPLGYAQVVRNAVLAGVCVTGLAGALSGTAVPELAGALLAMAAGAVAAVLVIMSDDIAALFAPT